jgi:hypothetical protein
MRPEFRVFERKQIALLIGDRTRFTKKIKRRGQKFFNNELRTVIGIDEGRIIFDEGEMLRNGSALHIDLRLPDPQEHPSLHGHWHHKSRSRCLRPRRFVAGLPVPLRKSVSTTSHHESHKGDGLLIHAQRVGIHLATGQEQRIIIVGVGVS